MPAVGAVVQIACVEQQPFGQRRLKQLRQRQRMLQPEPYIESAGRAVPGSQSGKMPLQESQQQIAPLPQLHAQRFRMPGVETLLQPNGSSLLG
ncbi:hypothetical protein D3C75_291270 [compost metagenome]